MMCGTALTATFAVIGHCWPLFAGLRGGMGLATAGGAFLAVECAGFSHLHRTVDPACAGHSSLGAGKCFYRDSCCPVLWLLNIRDVSFWVGVGAGSVIASAF
jgi:hypothetical protein